MIVYHGSIKKFDRFDKKTVDRQRVEHDSDFNGC